MNHPVVHVTENLISGWQITDPEGQHIAVVHGDRHDALSHAHRLIDDVGRVVLNAPDDL